MLAVEGSVTREIFETSLERVLAPEVRPRRIVAMDDLSAHRGERVRDPIEARGCELVYLPHYSPDLDPLSLTRLLASVAACCPWRGPSSGSRLGA